MHKYSKRINDLRNQRGWTVYELGKRSGITAQTIHNWFATDRCPQIPFIEQLCEAFGISLADFFANGEMVEVTTDKKELLTQWLLLTPEEQTAIIAHMKSYTTKRG